MINPNPPELEIRWYSSPEEVHRLMWEPSAIDAGMTYEQMMSECEVCGEDEHGNEVTIPPGAEFEGMRKQGCWAFIDTLNSCIHAWADESTDPEMVLHMLAHEIGHATGTPESDPLQEEMRAEQFGRVAKLAYQLLKSKDLPECAAPECGCADAYCRAWGDQA